MAIASKHANEEHAAARQRMVDEQIAARGIRDPAILKAFLSVPREAFVSPELAEFAHEDTPLPIEADQTISQPYIVAVMIQALGLKPADRVLEVGTGSGYAAALLGRIAAEVYTIERHEVLARLARERLERIGARNVHVLCGDGTRGWPEHAPFDAIVVAAGGPDVPRSLRAQLAVGGRLVMPVGDRERFQQLTRVTRASEDDWRTEELESVRFVPLIGGEGWDEDETAARETGRPASIAAGARPGLVAKLIRETAEPIDDIETASVGALLERIGDARVVLLGEATHGTSEFYRMRARITRELITRRGFDIVAVEADWADAARVDRHVRAGPQQPSRGRAFTRFPTWMWRNEDVHAFIEWLRAWNREEKDPGKRTGFYGLDLYGLHDSIRAVLEYLDAVDPQAGRIARQRYGCLTPWEGDPAAYGRAAVTGSYRTCEAQVVSMLQDMLERRIEYARRDGDRFLDAFQNARLIANGERYYRAMYYGSRESWNLRDLHMFETLETLLAFHGPGSRAVVWEHNSHVGDAAATEMSARGEINIGYLARRSLGPAAYTVGFGTDTGTVAAASDWDGPMEVKDVRPSHPESYERVCHESGVEAFLLALREPAREAVREELMPPRLERAIGVIYRPETELLSHYFQAVLPRQFDEYVWFDRTRAVEPLGPTASHGMPETYPFGL
jgi:protein-L-isoaspartate(D-aspartate) O-methyltransferase